jgi:16S rRNA (cytosine(1402)-N(4))-methyltransferase
VEPIASKRHEHVSVLLREILEYAPEHATRVLDGTLGLAGHSKALLEALPGATLIAFDRDESALSVAAGNLKPFAGRTELHHADFRDGIGSLLPASLDYAIADLGVSSLQLDDAERGFSFRYDAPLDMRMDRSAGKSASDILNTASEKELERIFTEFGEEPKARAIARSVIMERRSRSVWTTNSSRVPSSWNAVRARSGPRILLRVSCGATHAAGPASIQRLAPFKLCALPRTANSKDSIRVSSNWRGFSGRVAVWPSSHFIVSRIAS